MQKRFRKKLASQLRKSNEFLRRIVDERPEKISNKTSTEEAATGILLFNGRKEGSETKEEREREREECHGGEK